MAYLGAAANQLPALPQAVNVGGQLPSLPQMTNAYIPEQEQFAQSNRYADPFSRGVGSGMQGTLSAGKTYIANALENMGSPAAQDWQHSAEQNTLNAAAAAPVIDKWADVHGPVDLASYTAGKFGQFLPMMAPSLVGGGAASAMRLGAGARMAAGMVPMHPIMAGTVLERLNSDPATAGLSPAEKARIANTEGAVQAAIYATPGHIMQARSLGLSNPFGVAKGTLNPLRTAGNIAGETALTSAGMGGASVAANELGKAVQRQYNPNYEGESNTEAFAGGAAGMVPIALPHAALAHTIGATVKPVTDLGQHFANGVAAAGEALYKRMPEQAQEAMRMFGGTGKFTADTYNAVKAFGDEFTGATKKAFDEARQEYETTRSKQEAEALKTGEDVPIPDKTGALGQMAGAATKGTAKAFGSAFTNATFGKEGEGKSPLDALKELSKRAANYASGQAKTTDPVSTIFKPFEELVKEGLPEDSPLTAKLRELYAKHKSVGLNEEDLLDLGDTATALHAVWDKYGAYVNPDKAETTGGSGPKSASSLSGGKILRSALVNAHISESLATDIANSIDVRKLLRGGATKTLRDLAPKLKQIIDEHPDVAARPQIEKDAVYQRVRDLLDAAKPELQAERAKVAARTGQVVAQDPEALRGEVEKAARKLLSDQEGMESDPGFFRQAVDGITNTVLNTASGDRGHAREISRLAEGLMKHGEKADEFLDHITAAAQAAFGHDSAAVKRLERLGEGARGLKSSVDQYNAALKEQKPIKGVLSHMQGLLKAFRVAKQYDKTPMEAAHYKDELRAKMVDEPDFEKKTAIQLEINRWDKAMREDKSPMAVFMDRMKKEFKGQKGVYQALDAALRQEKQLLGSDMGEHIPNPEQANKAVIEDENARDSTAPDKPITLAGLSELADMQARIEENEGHQGEIDTPREKTRQYHGESTLRGEHKEGIITAPVSPMYSGDYEGGMSQATLKALRGTWGDKRVLDLPNGAAVTPMYEWAKDMAEQSKKEADAWNKKHKDAEHPRLPRSEDSFLNEALDKLLEHDKQRLANLENNPKAKTKEGADNTGTIKQTKDWIENRRLQAETLADLNERGRIFFHPEGTQRHYGYHAVEQASGENFAITPKEVKRFSPPIVNGERVSVGAYAREQAGREGVSETEVRESMVDVKIGKETVPMDMPRMMRELLFRHQQGDSTGVDALEGGTQAGKQSSAVAKLQGEVDRLKTKAGRSGFPSVPAWQKAVHEAQAKLDEAKANKNVGGDELRHPIYTDEELGRAVNTLLGALHEAGEVDIKPDTIIWRDAENKLVRRYEDTQHQRKTIDDVPLDKVLVPQVRRPTSGEGKFIDERDRMNRPARGTEKPATAAAREAEAARNAERDASNGIIRGLYPAKPGKPPLNVDAHALLKEMMTLHGLDPHEIGKLPKSLAAELIRDGLIMLRDRQGEHELMHNEGSKAGEVRMYDKESTRRMFDLGDARNAWENTVIYTRDYGDAGQFPVKLRELLKREPTPDLPRHDMDTARLMEARDEMKRVDAMREEIQTLREKTPDDKRLGGTWAATASPKLLAELRAEREKLQRVLGMHETGDKTPLIGQVKARLKAVEDTLRTAEEHMLDERYEKAARDENNALQINDEHKTRDTVHSDDEGEDLTLKSILKEHADATGETPLGDRPKVLVGKGRQLLLTEIESKLAERAAQAKGDALKRSEAGSKDALEKLRNNKTEGFKAAEKTADEHYAVVKGLESEPHPEAGTPPDTSPKERVLPAVEPTGEKAPTPVRGKKVADPELQRQFKEAQAKEASAKEDAFKKRNPSETRTRREAIQTEWAERRAAMLEKAARSATNRARAAEVEEMLAAQEKLNAVAETMPNKNPVDLSNAAPPEPGERMTVTTEKNGVKTTTFVDKAKDGNPFSESSKRAGATPEEALAAHREELTTHLRKLVGDIVEHLNLTKDAITAEDVAGMWDKTAKMISVSLYHPDQKGVLHHEAWHAVEDFLGTLGDPGKKILSQVYKHVDSPLMRKRLEGIYADDAGALKQIRTGDVRERAAYAFQAHMAGETLPLHPETAGVWGKIKGFIMRAARVLGYGNEGATTKNFFDFIKSGDFARDKGNNEPIVRGTGETKLQKAMSGTEGFLKPLQQAVVALVGHTHDRLLAHKVPAYTELASLFAGKTGKDGYNAHLNAAQSKYGNALAKVFNTDGKPDMEKLAGWDAMLDSYMDGRKLSEAERARIRASQTFDIKAMDEHYKEWENDVVQYGGFGDKRGEAQKVAQDVLNKGYFEHDKLNALFENRPDILSKWQDKSPYSSRVRMLMAATKAAERRKFFDEQDEHGNWVLDGKITRLLAEGDKTASTDAQQMARDFVDSYEGRLGSGTMTPATKKIMGALLVANNIRMLPLAVFSQMIEPAQLGFRKNDITASMGALWRGVKDLPRTFDKYEKSANHHDQWEILAEDLGTVASAQVGSMLTLMYNGIQIRGLPAKINDAFFKYNFMDGWNRSMHIASTKMAVEFIKEHAAGKSLKHSERFLKELGLDKSDVKVTEDGMLERSEKIDNAIIQFVNEAMAHPDAGSNPVWMNDERFALMAHMKRFNFAHAKYVLGRGVHEWENDNFMGIAPGVAAAFIFTTTGDYLKHLADITSDGSSYADTLGPLDYALFRTERAGMMGRWAMGLDIERAISQGGTGFESALGPTAELFSRVAQGAHKNNLLDAMMGNLPGMALASMPD